MNLLLRKIFIKNYQDVKNQDIRIKHGILASWIGITINTILICLKVSSAVIIAASSNWIFSMALLGDAINNTGDIASSVVSLIGFRTSKKPADKEHPFGHQRMEYIASLIVSMIIIFAAVALLKESITHLVAQDIISFDIFAYVVFGCSVGLKLFQAYIFFGFGKAISSPVLKGVGMDSILDVTSSSIILVGTILTNAFSLFWLDAALGIAIALFVAFSGSKMAKESIDFLLGKPIDKDESDAIRNTLLSVNGVLGVHDLIIHAYGASSEYISAHIEVDSTLSLLEAHRIAEGAEDSIKKKFGQPITIHVDPKQTDASSARIKSEIQDVLSKKFPEPSIHDFQIDGKTIRFDILMPFGQAIENEAEFATFLKVNYSSDYDYQITVDHPY